MDIKLVSNFSQNYRTIAVHNGLFHLDELVAICLLVKALDISTDPFENWEIVRTRDAEILKSAEFRLDVGMQHDVLNGSFDHHQEHGLVHPEGIPFAATGMVWDYFSSHILAQYYDCRDYLKLETEFYKQIILPTDAADTGKLPVDSRSIHFADLNAIIKTFNNQKDEGFKMALIFVWHYINNVLQDTNEKINDESIISSAIKEDSPILQLPTFSKGWKEYCAINAPWVKVALVPAEPGVYSITSAYDTNKQNVCCCPQHLRNAEEIGGCKKVFVHPSGYTGKVLATSEEEAIQAANAWING